MLFLSSGEESSDDEEEEEAPPLERRALEEENKTTSELPSAKAALMSQKRWKAGPPAAAAPAPVVHVIVDSRAAEAAKRKREAVEEVARKSLKLKARAKKLVRDENKSKGRDTRPVYDRESVHGSNIAISVGPSSLPKAQRTTFGYIPSKNYHGR